MALPIMTPEQRADALAKGALVRRERADIKERLKKGTLTLAELIDQADKSDVIGKLKVAAVLKCPPTETPETIKENAALWHGPRARETRK